MGAKSAASAIRRLGRVLNPRVARVGQRRTRTEGIASDKMSLYEK